MVQPFGSLTELREAIGAEGAASTFEVDKTTIRLLLEAVGDEEWPTEGPPGEAPLYLLCSNMISGDSLWPPIPFPFQRAVDGGAEWELAAPIRLGDRITSMTKFKDLTEREGKSGKMYFLTFETSHRNQDSELIGKSSSTAIGFDPIE